MSSPTFPDIYRGDTWKKGFEVELEGAITDCDIRMQIRKPGRARSAAALVDVDNTDDVANGITKVSATEFEVELTEEQTGGLEAGDYEIDIEFTLPDGSVETMREDADGNAIDRKITVTNDVTHD